MKKIILFVGLFLVSSCVGFTITSKQETKIKYEGRKKEKK